MSPLTDISEQLSTTGKVGLASAGVLALLMAKYPDRAIFDEYREGIPHRKGVPLLGMLPIVLSNRYRLHDLQLDNFESLDSLTVTSSSFGVKRRIFTIHPENVEHVLKHNFENYIKGPNLQAATQDLFGHGIFNANGEQWRFQRKAASFIFSVKNFRDHFTDVFVQEMQYVTDHILDSAATNHRVVDFHDLMYKFTLDSFVLLGFGVKLHGLQQEKQVEFAQSFDVCQHNSSWRVAFPFWRSYEALQSIFVPWRKGPTDHLKVVDDFAFKVIKERRQQMAEGHTFKDLLSRFMNTKGVDGELLDDRGLRDIIINFIIAGRDTTAQALSWTFYNLMLHPRVEKKLVDEIFEHVNADLESDSPALYEAIKNMPYAHAVLYEVLRLFPSVPGNQKSALKDDVLPDGTHIQAGDYVTWHPYAMGRSTKLWGADAKSFRPERWFNEDGQLKRESQGQWPAFHAGPRVCLGQQLATLESLVAIVMLLRRYKFTLVHDQEITYITSLTLPMKNGIKVFVEKRQ
ncbi:cytochrome p450 [Lichtheimia corymbifera JMRC:FSU:9682]|uniref:Cytochrome p450 n=1 Tax=Lichtheimia corymbifera JMRC:FSU:9682 TaxID=1263082 RepID=A0A068RPF8_9FUNG|nr:cytochrome p450 [Lichtheimia corymbifera JMRC:FSU:9682]